MVDQTADRTKHFVIFELKSSVSLKKLQSLSFFIKIIDRIALHDKAVVWIFVSYPHLKTNHAIPAKTGDPLIGRRFVLCRVSFCLIKLNR